MQIEGLWLPRWRSETEAHLHYVKEIIYSGRSDYQKIEIVLLEGYGKCLILDGIHQSAEIDEFIYHEAMVHPALCFHPNPKNVLVIGGGEGCVLREVLKHPSVEKAVMVDIDRLVVEKCSQHLSWEKNAYADPRVTLIFQDGAKFIAETDMIFDCVIVDGTTAKPDSIAFDLYGTSFYKDVYAHLSNNGILAGLQSNANILFLETHKSIRNTLNSIFNRTLSYVTYCPFYAISYAFALAIKGEGDMLDALDVKKRIEPFRSDLRFFDEKTYVHMFNIPKYMRDALESGGDILPHEKLIKY